MISDVTVAREMSDLMLEMGAKLARSLEDVRAKCPEEEFLAYRDGASRILTDMLIYVMNPLYHQHPSLEPSELE